jgi:aspartyl-tRNA synthetase
LGQLRNYLGECIGLRSKLYFNFAWIVDFPLFVKNSEGQLESAHHPSTAPMPEYLEDLQNSTDLLSIKGSKFNSDINIVFSSTL